MIYLGSDHGGYELKQLIISELRKKGLEYKDLGNTRLVQDDDYPDYAFKVAEAVVREPGSLGVLLCRSAAGMIIAANKVKGARAVAAFDERSAVHSREHNDANIIALSGDWLPAQRAIAVLDAWLKASFSGEVRHKRRLQKVREYEDSA